MKRIAVVIAIVAFCTLVPAYGLYQVSDAGSWPENWPVELEKLRKQSWTFVGPTLQQPHHAIPFTKQEEFEAAWPHLLKVKSKGAPIFLVVTNPTTDFFGVKPAGVLIHSPIPVAAGKQSPPELPSKGVPEGRTRWMNTTYIELVVDGNIVDLNRIALPADTPIVDERFNAPPNQPAGQNP